MLAALAPTAPAVRAGSRPGCSSRAAAARRPLTLAPPNPLRSAAAARRLGLPARGRARGLAASAMLSTEQLVGLAIFFSPSVAALIYAYVRGKGNLRDGLSHLLTDVSKVRAERAGLHIVSCCWLVWMGWALALDDGCCIWPAAFGCWCWRLAPPAAVDLSACVAGVAAVHLNVSVQFCY